MNFTKTTVEVEDSTVEVITEIGDGVYLIPGESHAFQVRNGRRIAGTSFQEFGADCDRSAELEARWVEAAQAWYDEQMR